MPASTIVFLLEEKSMEVFLQAVIKLFLPVGTHVEYASFNGKPALMKKLVARLRGLSKSRPSDTRYFIIVDRDHQDCKQLKSELEKLVSQSGLTTRAHHKPDWQAVTRIAIEELEAWYFGDWQAVRALYPKLPNDIPHKSKFRNPDAVQGGTWEALERLLIKNRCISGPLNKPELARLVGQNFKPSRCTSTSFNKLWTAVEEAVT